MALKERTKQNKQTTTIKKKENNNQKKREKLVFSASAFPGFSFCLSVCTTSRTLLLLTPAHQ